MSAATLEAPAPTQSTTPAPTPTVVPATGLHTFADAKADLDAFAATLPSGEPEPKTAPTPPKEPAKPAEKPPEAKKEAVKNEPAKPAPTPEKTPEQTPTKAAELRTAYESAKSQLAEREKRIAELEAKTADNSKEQAWTQEKQAMMEKQAKLQEKLNYLDYSQSDEYVEKYQRPVDTALESAAADVKQLTVQDGEGNLREATWQDFAPLLRKPLGEAAKLAKELFGETAMEVMAHRRKILEANQAATKAVEEYKTKGSESAKQQQEKYRAEEQRLTAMFDDLSRQGVENFEHLKIDPADKDGKAAFDKDVQLVDAHFKGAKGLSPEGSVKLAALVRTRALAYPRVAKALESSKAEVAELTKKLEAFEKSKPSNQGEDRGSHETNGQKSESIDETIAFVIGKK